MLAPKIAKIKRYGFLLLPQFSFSSFALATDALSRANQQAGHRLYEYISLSLEQQQGKITASNGIIYNSDLDLSYAPKLDALIVIGDDLNIDINQDRLSKGISTQNADILLGGVGTGSYWLAKLGLLNGRRATIHWQEIHRFTDEFLDVIISSNLYEIDENRATCAGGSATLDFMLTLIAQDQGNEFSAHLSETFSMERVRQSNERQRVPLATRIGNSQPKLTEAVSLMEANIEEPLSTDDIAYYVGVSRRQLERLFKQYLNTVPSRYYLELRLNRARQLLQQSSKSIVQIGLSCGFSSGPHFSSTYRNHFGVTPREERVQSNPSMKN